MRNEHLKAHQRRHQDPSEKPFACEAEDCGLKFWTSSQLKNHVQACHADHLSTVTGMSAQDYPCTEPGCDMTFHKRKQLRLHIRDHHSVSASAEQTNGDGDQTAKAGGSAAVLPFASAVPFGLQIYSCTMPGVIAPGFDDGPWIYSEDILDR